ncbi:MAG TPA: hypothetical protein PKY35_15380, partial [Candidatus Hydrogenedentes bacterium]|nr:hypothetical protein [Candidatus Hydrogenedentota bacterium]
PYCDLWTIAAQVYYIYDTLASVKSQVYIYERSSNEGMKDDRTRHGTGSRVGFGCKFDWVGIAGI